MINHLALGQRGEAIAQAYVRRYCSVLHLNWKSGRREIDIIAGKGNAIYFIEVKTRSSARYGWPEEAVDWRKQAHIQEAASDYLLCYNLYPAVIRFDIIAIILMGEEYELRHFRDVF
jgi:putative endonuclease